MAKTFTVGLLGASDVQNRSCRDWPLLMVRQLQAGRASTIVRAGFGKETSTANITDGYAQRLIDMRPDIAIISVYKDANGAVTPAQSLTNMYTIIDGIRAKRADTAIFLLKTWRLAAASEASTFPNLSSIWANYATAAANRSNVQIIDAYTAWGDPALHPEEYDAGDPLHPLLAGLQRVTIPTAVSALAPLIT